MSSSTKSLITVSLIVALGLASYFLTGNKKDTPSPTSYSVAEVSKHNTKKDCWTIINESVYDLTEYVNRHPGGSEILRACGTDGSTLFNSRTTSDGEKVGSGSSHSSSADSLLGSLKIGKFKSGD